MKFFCKTAGKHCKTGVGERTKHRARGNDAARREAVREAREGEHERAGDESELHRARERADVARGQAPCARKIVRRGVRAEPQRRPEQLGEDDQRDREAAHAGDFTGSG